MKVGIFMDLLTYLGITTEAVSPEQVQLKLAVQPQVQQPYGLLHGGINAVLAETAASLGANASLKKPQVAVGVAVETHHLSAVTAGTLWTVATPIRLGHQLQVWQAKTYQTPGQWTSVSTVTLKVQTLS
ncbi:hypothetical protein FC07_GL001023 [Loigolactobacillus bifermentans DSM 20003]|uniref:Thioesterase domain-containing protein n=2 Tax=Loigolactobacillus bifermentans TaxID=1607 RepID=A0A0R1H8K5_9LACO|nr:hypothetical protein FC07_GL001023 [Loigolactobacillus bifermentans DSM 20003]